MLVTPFLIIHCAVYFEFDNDYEKTLENSYLLSSKIIQIVLLLGFLVESYALVMINDFAPYPYLAKLWVVHNILSLVIFYEMSKFFKFNSEPLFHIISMLFFIQTSFFIIDIFTSGLFRRDLMINEIPTVKEISLSVFAISQIFLFVRNVLYFSQINVYIQIVIIVIILIIRRKI